MNPIREWLNTTKSYTLGVALYAIHGTDPDLLDMFRQGHSPYRQGRLETALRQLIKIAEKISVADNAPVHITVAVAEAQMPESAVSDSVDIYRQEWLPLYMEMNTIRHKLIHAPDDRTRGEWAHKILSLERQCMKIWERRDYHLRTGAPMTVKTDGPVVITDKNELRKNLTNMRSYISKKKKKITDANREILSAEIAALQEQVKAIEQQLQDYL